MFSILYLLLFVATLMMMADLSPSSTTSWWCSGRRQIHYKQVKLKKPGELAVWVVGGWVSAIAEYFVALDLVEWKMQNLCRKIYANGRVGNFSQSPFAETFPTSTQTSTGSKSFLASCPTLARLPASSRIYEIAGMGPQMKYLSAIWCPTIFCL